MSDITSLIYQDVPNNRLQAKILTNVSPLDWWIVGVSFLVMVGTAVWTYNLSGGTVQPVAFVLFEALFVVAMMYRMRDGYGRLYDEIGNGLWTTFKNALFKGVWWQAEDTSAWFIRWLRDRNGKRQAFPFSFVNIKAVVDKSERHVTLLREDDRPYDRVYIGVRGGSFAAHGPNMQAQLVNMLAEITNRTVAQADLKLGISYLGMVGPANDMELPSFFSRNINPFIADLESFDTSNMDEDTLNWARQEAKGIALLRPTIKNHGGSRRFGIVQIVIKRNKKTWRKAKKNRLTNEELYDLPVVELSHGMADALRTTDMFEFDEVKVLGLADLSEVLRCARDVTDIQGYYQQRKLGSIPATDEAIAAYIEEHGTKDLVKTLGCWPQNSVELDREGKWLRIDNTYFAALRIKQVPGRVRADQVIALNNLGGPGIWTRYATVGQSVSGDTETRNLIVQSSMMTNFNRAFFSGRVTPDPRKLRRQQKLETQTEQVSAHTIAQNFNVLFTVAASNPRDALRQRAAIAAGLRASNFIATEVNEIGRVKDAVISGIFGVSRL